jgi:hypothetical protein
MAHGITKRFMGFDVPNGLGAGETFIADYVVNNEPSVNDLRNEVTRFTGEMMNIAWDLVGKPEWKENAVTFVSPIQRQVDAYKQSQDVIDNTLRSSQV